jgi:hypothetical protein
MVPPPSFGLGESRDRRKVPDGVDRRHPTDWQVK